MFGGEGEKQLLPGITRNAETKSIKSAKFDDLFTREAILQDFEESFLRYPIDNRQEWGLGKVDVEDRGDGWFMSLATLDGKKVDTHLKEVGRGDGTDIVIRRLLWKIDRTEGVIIAHDYEAYFVGDEPKADPFLKSHLTFSEDPLHMEAFVEFRGADGVWTRDAETAEKAVTAVMQPILKRIAFQKIKVRVQDALTDMGDGPGAKSVVSDPIEGTDPDKLLEEAYLAGRRDFPEVGDELTDSDYQLVIGEGEHRFCFTVSVDRIMRRRRIEISSRNGITRIEFYWQIHENPMRIEAWRVIAGKRELGQHFWQQTQVSINELVDKIARESGSIMSGFWG